MTDGTPTGWRQSWVTIALAVAIAFAGCMVGFALWLHDFMTPQVAFLGSGDQLSILVAEGPARLVLATGDDPVEFEKSLARFRPLFARRVDVLLVAGDGDSLLVPLRVLGAKDARTAFSLNSLPQSDGYESFSVVQTIDAPRRIRLGPSVSVTIETAHPIGAVPDETPPSWRATIERGDSRIVVLSDGEAGALFPPGLPASLLAVSSRYPERAWESGSAIAFVASANAITGPEMRSAFIESRLPPAWGFRVAPGEALRIRFVSGGIEIASDSAQDLNGSPLEAASVVQP